MGFGTSPTPQYTLKNDKNKDDSLIVGTLRVILPRKLKKFHIQYTGGCLF